MWNAGIWTRVTVSISYDDNHYTTGCFIGKVNSFRDELFDNVVEIEYSVILSVS